MTSHDELMEIAIRAYKNLPSLNASSPGLVWLRTPLERAVKAIEPVIRADERERLLAAWSRDNHDVRFNKAHDDLTPQGRVAKWMREVET